MIALKTLFSFAVSYTIIRLTEDAFFSQPKRVLMLHEQQFMRFPNLVSPYIQSFHIRYAN